MMKSSVTGSPSDKQVVLAPEVDVSELEMELRNRELTKFETTNNVIRKQNHLTGVIEQIHINPAKFYE